jgi:hypothetical protein
MYLLEGWSDLIPIAVTLVSVAGTVFLAWFQIWLKKKGLNAEVVDKFGTIIDAIGSRMRDKFLMELAEKKANDGANEITAQEFSELRQNAYDLLMQEVNGAVREHAAGLGEQVVKGILGKYISSGTLEIQKEPTE